ncbi:protein ALTERED XYLOGLUCAN 4-like [Hibiscus syriacus]|uniref:protein ALTERED XYLOGLUCAN 4-like n=1 Tax=Hibiscus syriacus TaxID=106335 RepID=UPI00192232C4|nr:protein ALTERED XYLOGLUCAN 4-like [Hibiscus syriacus]
MGVTSPPKGHSYPYSLAKKLLPYSLYPLYVLLPIALFSFCLHIFSSTPSLTHLPSSKGNTDFPTQELIRNGRFCNYNNGRWVHDKMGPLYNGTTCGTIKDGQNCISHGRPDLDYLYWRWKPRRCWLPRFDPDAFMTLLNNKHVAFLGDSMARNQLESLLCILATVSKPNLIYTSGEDNKFRRWHFASHNIVVSVYWSPFLVRGFEKSRYGPNYNELYVDSVDERWGADLDHIDMIVLSIGHWFLHPAVYYEGGSVLGCHHCNALNHTEIGFYGAMRKAIKMALKTIIERKGANNGNGIDVFFTTFSPSHFEGEWDNAGACSRTKPYRRGERKLEGMDAEMRAIVIEEMEAARLNAKRFNARVRLAILDVTKLSLLRPDGHPGPYMYAFPFANGIHDRVQNDCVHWCLPGPIDTWNQIMLQVIKRWNARSRRVVRLIP